MQREHACALGNPSDVRHTVTTICAACIRAGAARSSACRCWITSTISCQARADDLVTYCLGGVGQLARIDRRFPSRPCRRWRDHEVGSGSNFRAAAANGRYRALGRRSRALRRCRDSHSQRLTGRRERVKVPQTGPSTGACRAVGWGSGSDFICLSLREPPMGLVDSAPGAHIDRIARRSSRRGRRRNLCAPA